MSDERECTLGLSHKERHMNYLDIIAQLRSAMTANMLGDADAEREACVLAWDLLNEMMGA